MINIEELTQSSIGSWVTYNTRFGESEIGRIKSWNNFYVFVVYKCDSQWNRFQDFTGCATNPEDLIFKENNT